jgi:hypothetical protein
MAIQLSKPHPDAVDDTHSGGVFQLLRDLLKVCRRSWAAADHYEELKSMSDPALAEKGIERKDLARVAFDRLSRDD